MGPSVFKLAVPGVSRRRRMPEARRIYCRKCTEIKFPGASAEG
jgi:RNase P subunit RPR2